MRTKVAPDVVDRSRAGHLVHACTQSGRGVRLVTYIEGLQGDEGRLEVDEHIVCRTAEQAAELARVLREARTDGGGGAQPGGGSQ